MGRRKAETDLRHRPQAGKRLSHFRLLRVHFSQALTASCSGGAEADAAMDAAGVVAENPGLVTMVDDEMSMDSM